MRLLSVKHQKLNTNESEGVFNLTEKVGISPNGYKQATNNFKMEMRRLLSICWSSVPGAEQGQKKIIIIYMIKREFTKFAKEDRCHGAQKDFAASDPKMPFWFSVSWLTAKPTWEPFVQRASISTGWKWTDRSIKKWVNWGQGDGHRNNHTADLRHWQALSHSLAWDSTAFPWSTELAK